MAGIVALLAAVVVTVAVAAIVKARNGRFAEQPPRADAHVLLPSDIGTELGERATLVQFSTAFCSPCRATRVLLNDIAAKVDGVVSTRASGLPRREQVLAALGEAVGDPR